MADPNPNPVPAPGNKVPSNLPLAEADAPVSTALPASSTAPSQPQPSPTPPTATNLGPVKATVRTMADDLRAVEAKQSPQGSSVEIGAELAKPALPTPPPAPIKPTASLPDTIPLGSAEKRSTPLPSTVIPPPITPITAPSPTAGGSRRLKILLGVLLLVAVLAAAAYWFALRVEEEEPIAPLATETAAPTPAVIFDRLGSFFTDSLPIEIAPAEASSSFDVFRYMLTKTDLSSELNQLLIDPRDATGAHHSFTGLLTELATDYPADLAQYIDDRNLGLVLSRQTEFFDNKGRLLPVDGTSTSRRLALVARVTDSQPVRAILAGWEGSLSADLATLFELPNLTVPPQFMNNTYRDAVIRYANFPNPDRSIDYVVVRAIDGENYLLITNSRQQVYSLIDTLLGF